MNEEILELINQNKNIEELKCNRNNLNKVIKWSSSKYNEYTKSEIIDNILYHIELSDDSVINYCSIINYSCGSYAEGNHNRGKHYTLVLTLDVNYLSCDYGDSIKIYKLK